MEDLWSLCLHAALECVSDYHEKILYLTLGLILGVRLILKCDFYSNKSGISDIPNNDVHAHKIISFMCPLKTNQTFFTQDHNSLIFVNITHTSYNFFIYVIISLFIL